MGEACGEGAAGLDLLRVDLVDLHNLLGFDELGVISLHDMLVAETFD